MKLLLLAKLPRTAMMLTMPLFFFNSGSRALSIQSAASPRTCFISGSSSSSQISPSSVGVQHSNSFSSVLLCSAVPHFGRRGNTNLQQMFLSSSSSGSDEQQPTLTNIGKTEMMEILSHVENGTGEESYVVMDVRGVDEIMGTGKLSDVVHILPLPQIASMGAFNMDEESFEEQFNFPKPKLEDTLVFSCKAGIRSQHAAQLAAMSGYKTMVNYVGGSDDWFGGGQNMW